MPMTALKVFDVREYGAVGDGSTDDTAAFRNALTDAVDTDGAAKRIVFIPAGTYKMTGTLEIRRVLGLIVRGASRSGTTLVWRGPATDPLFRLLDVRDSEFSDFYVTTSGNGTSPALHSVFWSETEFSGGVFLTSGNSFRNIHIDGTLHGLQFGWYFTDEAYKQDKNNDLCRFDNCGVSNYTEAGWYFGHSQSKQHRLHICGGNGAASNAKYIIWTKHGSWHYLGGGGGNCQVAFYFENYAGGDMINIQGHDDEGSARLIEFAGVSGAAYGMRVSDVRFAGDKLNGDKVAVIWQRNGPLLFENCSFGGFARVTLGNSTEPWAAVFVGCGFQRDLAADPDYNSPFNLVLSGRGRFEVINCSFQDQQGAVVDLQTLRTRFT